jgi:hypothetical protein
MTSSIAEDIKKVVDMGESLPPNKIVGGIKRVTVKQGMENEFESLFIALAAKILLLLDLLFDLVCKTLSGTSLSGFLSK